jgi:hypothetical protein
VAVVFVDNFVAVVEESKILVVFVAVVAVAVAVVDEKIFVAVFLVVCYLYVD